MMSIMLVRGGLIASCVLALAAPLLQAQTPGRIYYVDNASGSNGNNGFGVNLHVTNASSPVLSAGYYYLVPSVDFTGTTRTANNSVGAYAENP